MFRIHSIHHSSRGALSLRGADGEHVATVTVWPSAKWPDAGDIGPQVCTELAVLIIDGLHARAGMAAITDAIATGTGAVRQTFADGGANTHTVHENINPGPLTRDYAPGDEQHALWRVRAFAVDDNELPGPDDGFFKGVMWSMIILAAVIGIGAWVLTP